MTFPGISVQCLLAKETFSLFRTYECNSSKVSHSSSWLLVAVPFSWILLVRRRTERLVSGTKRVGTNWMQNKYSVEST